LAEVHYLELGDYCLIAAEVLGTTRNKVAALVEHLARNHPLPDGNKRCAFLAVERLVESCPRYIIWVRVGIG
jgi:hypothetical protein